MKCVNACAQWFRWMPRYNKRQLSHHKHRSKGLALISVLWLVGLLGVLALSILSLVKTDKVIAHNVREEAQAEGLADAGVYLTIHQLCDVHLLKEVPIDGQPRTVSIAGQDVEITVQDELGKIDLNFAPSDILKSLFISAGLDEVKSQTIVQNIEARRAASLASANEAFPSDSPKSNRSLPFRTIDELKSIPGITDAIFQRIQPALTVYSLQPTVQTATAPKEVLLALPHMEQKTIDSIMLKRQEHAITASDIGMTETVSGQDATSGRSFTILSKAHSGQGSSQRKAVVLITGNAKSPYGILDWGSNHYAY